MKTVVLLSSGLDSLVNLYAAHAKDKVSLALTFAYGQRAEQREVENSKSVCQKLGISHQVVPLDFFKFFGNSALLNLQGQLPLGSAVDITSQLVSEKTAKSVWVPNRNGIFLNIAAGFAEAIGADAVIVGFNKEEATTFADNTDEFMKQSTACFKFSTKGPIAVDSHTVHMTKTDIVNLGKTLGVDWSGAWPCYQNLEKWCGQCESCQRARRAFNSAGVDASPWFLA